MTRPIKQRNRFGPEVTPGAFTSTVVLWLPDGFPVVTISG
jgi:hypothetical protein